MDADLKRLEDKINKLVSMYSSLQEQNVQLRDDLIEAQKNAEALKNKMLLASQKLEVLLETIPVATPTLDTEQASWVTPNPLM